MSHYSIIQVTDQGMAGSGLFERWPVAGTADLMRHGTVSEAALRRSMELLDQALEYDETLELFDLLHLGRSMFQDHEYAQALVSGWLICEKLLNLKWDEHLDELNTEMSVADGNRKKRINAARRRALSSLEMSVKIEFLELSELLSFGRYEVLSSVRKRRNNWIHGLDFPDPPSAIAALKLASELLSEETEVPLHLAFSRSIGAV